MTNIKTEDLKEALDILEGAADSESTAELAALDGAPEEAIESTFEETTENLLLDGVERHVEASSVEMTTGEEPVVEAVEFTGPAEFRPAAAGQTEPAGDAAVVGVAAGPDHTPVEDAEIAVLNDTAEAGPEPEETPEEEARELAALDTADADEPGTDAVDGDMEDPAEDVAEIGTGQNNTDIIIEKDSEASPVEEEEAPEAAGEKVPSEPKMALLVSVGFRNAGKKLYYRTGGFDLHIGDRVIVETVRGMEMGSVVMPPMQMDLRRLHLDPAAIVRPANAVDMDQEAENRAREREAYHVCKQKIREHGLDMKLVQAEYTFDRNKLIFYFTADGRVDFRQLLKDLASTFHTRIELRQIGVRDETRVLGGIGVCGREVCCKTYLRTFAPVSVKMAKEQNLSLNPTKISGLCGRLMCCLKNEEETYEYLNRAMPRLGSRVQTKEGETGIVKNIDILKQKASVLFEENDEREMRVYNVSDLVFRSYRGKREDGLPVPPPVSESGVETADDVSEVEIDMSVESELGAGREEAGRGDRRGERRGRRNDRSDRGDRSDRRGGNRGRNYRGNRDESREGGSEEDRTSGDLRENGGNSRRNNDSRRGSSERSYRKNAAEGMENGGRRANGGYDRGYRRDNNNTADSSEDGGKTNGGYSRGYRDDFKGGDHRRTNRNRRNDSHGRYTRDSSGGRTDGSDAQGKRENRRPAEEQS